MGARSRILAVIVALAGCPMAAGAQATAAGGLLGAAPVYREFRDWVVVCDNTRACFAKCQGDEMAGSTGYLSVAREPGPGGKLVVSIEDWDEEHPADPSTLRLDGKRLAEDPGWRTQDKGEVDTLEGAAALVLLRAIADGRALGYGEAEYPSKVSLAGLKAALLAIDEDQGRLGAQDAFVRVGPRPASSNPPAAAVPILHAPPPGPPLEHATAFAAAVRRAQAGLLKQRECEDETVGRDDEAFALGQGEALIVLNCIYGAYQVGSLVFVAPRASPERARLLVLPTPPTAMPDPDGGGWVTDADWDAKRSILSESAKGRGLADCGSSTQWAFDGEHFRIAAYNALNRCTGGPPGDWAAVYRTRVVAGP